jgi:DNA-binding NarL/FixJ family response regulator
MDVSLEGGREGIEAARWLREVCDIPVVFVTAYTDRDTVKRIMNRCPAPQSSQSHFIASTFAKAVAIAGEPWQQTASGSEKGRRAKPTRLELSVCTFL